MKNLYERYKAIIERFTETFVGSKPRLDYRIFSFICDKFLKLDKIRKYSSAQILIFYDNWEEIIDFFDKNLKKVVER